MCQPLCFFPGSFRWTPGSFSNVWNNLKHDYGHRIGGHKGFVVPPPNNTCPQPLSNPRAEMFTLSQTVMETPGSFTGQPLAEQQVSMLGCQSPRVWLSGPPGTGANLLLQQKAREWLSQGYCVMMLSLWTASHAATLCLHKKIKQDMTTEPDNLHLVLETTTDFQDVMEKLQQLKHHIQESQSMDKGIGDDLQSFNSSGFETNENVDDDDDDMEDFEIVTSKSLKQEIPVEKTKTENFVMTDSEGDHEEDMIADPQSEKEGKNDTNAFPEYGDDLDFSLLDPGKEQMTESSFVQLDTSSEGLSKQPNVQESHDELEFSLLYPGNEQMIESEFVELNASFEGLNKQLRGQKSSDPSELKAQHGLPGPKEAKDMQQKLHVIVDEAPCFLNSFMPVLEKILGKDGFVIWAATSLPCTQPSGFTCFELTRSLRCPPSVVREMMETSAYKIFRRVMYKSQDTPEDTGVLSVMPLPTDGPMVKRVQHHGHGVKDVWDCEQCGKELAKFLTHDLKIAPEMSASSETPDNTLHFSDVLISGYLTTRCNSVTPLQRSSEHEPDCQSYSPDSPSNSKGEENPLPGFLKGLGQNGVPFELMVKGDVRSYHRLADPQSKDSVQVAKADMVKGLERAVVVVLGTVDFLATAPQYLDPLYDAMGCCTSQLITIGLIPGCHVQRRSF